ncbi:cation diffusion facilitator family transporter [Micromonospora sp. NPDC050200]|uniref:cation diffusion facilitator family transporter n=1 Tax=Micromonospora sp. NPDC050200 TaxID=3155664 RepID=UPI0033E2EFF4
MGAGHNHGGEAMRAGARHRKPLWAALAVLATFMVVEAVAAWLTGSLALLSDAAHMFTDVLGIALAVAAITAAGRSSDGGHRTFGLYRLEVLAALANAVLLFGVGVFVLVEAVRRFGDPPQVLVLPMFLVAIAGLIANVVAFLLLRAGAKESLNVRGAYLEVLSDLLGSVGVIAAAVVIATTGWLYADLVVAVAVGVFILPRTWQLARAALRVLVQAAPPHIEVAAVRASLIDLPGVADVHDLHVWTLTSGMDVASAHLSLRAGAELGPVLAAARARLHDGFGIDHCTLQVEPSTAEEVCDGVRW